MRLTPELEKNLRELISKDPESFSSDIMQQLLSEIDALRTERDQLNLEITTLKNEVHGWKEYAKNLIFK